MAEEEKKNKKPVEINEKAETEPVPVSEVKEIVAVPALPEEIPQIRMESALDRWQPKTELGKAVFNGVITNIDDVLKSGKKIIEAEIVDKLVPDLKNELVLIGGRTGKGGGIQRIPVRITAAMHKSGRRFNYSSLVVVGNENGIVGIGRAGAPETRDAIAKAIRKAKLNIIKVSRGCGSWECGCGTEHSIPFKVTGKSGSVKIELLPAPKGVGLVADDETKKLLRMAGIKDIWVKSYGNTSMRINLITAVFNALKKIYTYQRSEE